MLFEVSYYQVKFVINSYSLVLNSRRLLGAILKSYGNSVRDHLLVLLRNVSKVVGFSPISTLKLKFEPFNIF